MIPPRQIASLLAVFAASCVCGSWVAGRAGRALSPAAVSQTPAKPTKAAQRPSSGGTIPAAAVKCLEEVRGAGDVQDKLRATIQLAQSLPLSELKAWFEGKWFDEKEDILSAVFYQIAISRWLAADPASLMRYCHLKEESRAALVAWEWALRDSRAAFAYLGEVHDTALREKMASHMAMALAIHQPEAAIGEMPLLLSTLGTHELWLLMAKLAETAPDTLKTAAANWPPYTREGIARELATVGLKRDLAGTLEELRNTENGRAIFLNAFPFHSEALAEVIRNPGMLPPGWFSDIAIMAGSLLVQGDPDRWLKTDLAGMGLNPNQARQIRSYAIQEIGMKDRQRFLSLLDEEGYDRFHRNNIIGSTVARLAENRAQAEAWITGLPADEDKEAARQALASRLDQPKGETMTPAGLLDGLAKDGAILTAEQARATGIWSAPELQQATSRFDTLPVEQKAVAARNLLNHSHENFPPELQAQAIRFFTSDRSMEPALSDRFLGKRTLTQAASLLAANWAREDPAAAGKWVNSLPEGEERLWAAKNLGFIWNESDPSAANRWIEALPEQDRQQINEYLKSGEDASQ